jgi:hemolysin III
MFQKLREPVSGLMQLGAAAVAGVGMLGLVYVGRESIAKQASLLVYGLTLVAMFSASATYHLVNAKPAAMKFLRKMDHSAIYLVIAGTYTPICFYFFTGFWQWGMLALIWTMAIAGIVVKLFVLNAPRWITAAIYLVMGWLGVFAIPEMIHAMPAGAIAWLFAGGIFFTVGALVYIFKKPDWYPNVFGFHEVWHIFVILGALCHFIVIAAYVAPAPFLA